MAANFGVGMDRYTFVFLSIVLFSLLSLALVGGVAFVAIHFIAKFW